MLRDSLKSPLAAGQIRLAYLGLVVERVIGQFARDQQGIGGEGLSGDVEGCKEWDGHADLEGRFDSLAVTTGRAATFFGVWHPLAGPGLWVTGIPPIQTSLAAHFQAAAQKFSKATQLPRQ